MKKGQIDVLVYGIITVILAGFFIAIISPIVNEYRLDLVQNPSGSENLDNPLFKIVMFAFSPYMWLAFLFTSVILIVVLVAQTSRSPL
jgi:hypothetical protein